MATLERVIVTGSSGFIGGWVVRSLHELLPDVQIRVLLRNDSQRWRLPGSRVEVFRGDLTDAPSLAGLATDSQALLHCASYVGPSSTLAAAVNARGTEALLAEARRVGVARLVYVSTAGVYGRGPFTNAVHERLALNPGSPASATRLTAEQEVRAAGGTVLRPNLVYGAGDRWVGSRLARLATAFGEQVDAYQARLSMVDVRRLAEAAVAAARALAPVTGGRVYDCNHPEPVVARACLTAFRQLVVPPTISAPTATAMGTLPASSGALTHDQAMVAVDHWFDSRRVWTDCHVAPGPPFGIAHLNHAEWYRNSVAPT